MDERKSPNRRVGVVAIIAVAAGAWILVQQLQGPAVHEAEGTITSLDIERREAAVEVIDAANGTTREFAGAVPPECLISFDGRSVAFDDLRVGDVVHVWAHTGREGPGADGMRHARFIAERIEVVYRETGIP